MDEQRGKYINFDNLSVCVCVLIVLLKVLKQQRARAKLIGQSQCKQLHCNLPLFQSQLYLTSGVSQLVIEMLTDN